MNQELQQVSVRRLKQDIRGAVEFADRKPGPMVVELRRVLDIIIRDVYRRRREDDPGTKPLQNLLEVLKKDKYLSENIKKYGDFLVKIGNDAAHSERKITESEFITSLQNLLSVLRWYEGEDQTAAADESANRLDEIERPLDKDGRYADKMVILAGNLPGSDVDEEWDAIRKFLINDGVTVLSDDISLAESSFGNALLVQLFSTLDRLDQCRQQFEKSGLPSDSKGVLRWRKTLPNPRIDSEILKSFDDEDRQFCEGARTGLFEEFKLAVRDRLQELVRPSDPNPIPRVKPYLYITADRSNKTDYDYAGKLQDAARKYADVDVMKEGKEGEQKSDFKEALKIAAGIVFLYGDTQPKFYRKLAYIL